MGGVILAVLALLQYAGAFGGLQRHLDTAFFQLRGERETSSQVLLVSVDDTYVERASPPPFSGSELAGLLNSLERGEPAAVAVQWQPGLFAVDEAVGRVCKSDKHLLFVGASERPATLPEECAWMRWGAVGPAEALALPDADRPLLRRLLTFAGDGGAAGALADKTNRAALRVNFVGGRGLPRLSAAHAASDDLAADIFRGRVVWLVPALAGAARVDTPFGPLGTGEVRAEAVGTWLDDAPFHTVRWPVYLLLVLGVVLGAWLLRKHFAVPLLVGLTAAWFVVEWLAFCHGIRLQAAVSVVGAWAAFVSMQGLHIFEDEVRAEVRDRLLTAVHHAEQRRALGPDDDVEFWEGLLLRARKLLPVDHVAIAELPAESWWIEFRAFHQTSEDAIAERRRDVRRAPYRVGLNQGRASVTTDYLHDERLETVLVPLHAAQRLRGFWFLYVADAKVFLREHRALLDRIAGHLAQEIYWWQLERETPGLLQRRMEAADEIMESALAAMERQELDRRTLEDVAENARVGLMLTNLFGEVTFENSAIARLLVDEQGRPLGYTSLAELVSQLRDESLEVSTARLQQVLVDEAPLTFRASVGAAPQRMVELRVTLAFREGGEDRQVIGMIVTAVDITRAVAQDHQKLALVRTIHTRAADQMSLIAGYTQVLAMSDGLGEAERELVHGLQAGLGDMNKTLDDFANVLDPPARQDVARLPVALQHVVREALRSTGEDVDLPPIELDMPEELVTAEGHPESLQRALKLILVDSLEFVAMADRLRISLDENDGQVSVSLDVPGLGLPNALMQRLLEETPGEVSREDNRLVISKSYVEASGGRLEAASSVDGGTRFVIRLPKHGSGDG